MKLEGRLARLSISPEGIATIVVEAAPPINEPSYTPVTLVELERKHIKATLKHTKSLTEAARTLGINVSTLWRKRQSFSRKEHA